MSLLDPVSLLVIAFPAWGSPTAFCCLPHSSGISICSSHSRIPMLGWLKNSISKSWVLKPIPVDHWLTEVSWIECVCVCVCVFFAKEGVTWKWQRLCMCKWHLIELLVEKRGFQFFMRGKNCRKIKLIFCHLQLWRYNRVVRAEPKGSNLVRVTNNRAMNNFPDKNLHPIRKWVDGVTSDSLQTSQGRSDSDWVYHHRRPAEVNQTWENCLTFVMFAWQF